MNLPFVHTRAAQVTGILLLIKGHCFTWQEGNTDIFSVWDSSFFFFFRFPVGGKRDINCFLLIFLFALQTQIVTIF